MNFLTKIKQEKFKYCLIAILSVLFLFFALKNRSTETIKLDENLKADQETVHIFVQQGCIHCSRAKEFLNQIKDDYPNIKFEYHDLAYSESVRLLFQYANQLNLDMGKIGTPLIVSGDKCIIGFDNEQNQGREIKDLLEKRNLECESNGAKAEKKIVKIPLFGEIDILNTSLPMLAMILGLADGFNPCAMWVLVYLISIVAGLNDRKKIWFLVGSFVVSSGILYYLFMTAWLNVFLYLGYIRILAIGVGLFALYFGIMQIYEFIQTRGEVFCKLTNNQTRKKSLKRIDKLAQMELSLLSILGIVGLAFVVNSIEFACSAVLPAIFTFVLTQANLSRFVYYMYILLYDIFFMLDDVVVFGLAVIAVNKTVGTKYQKYSGIIGGIAMVIIGIMIVFFPNSLR